ncbi:MAG: hypothetical protein HDS43_04440 [Bacteroides sp.]|nr:hypothetical protein [Bacteroides sp.]
MSINYFIIGASIIIVGTAGVYYLVKKIKNGTPNFEIKFREVEVISTSEIGPWLKDLDVDIDDFKSSRHLFVQKNLSSKSEKLNFPDDIVSSLKRSSNPYMLAFILSDSKLNTESVLIISGKEISPNLEKLLKNDVTELKLY